MNGLLIFLFLSIMGVILLAVAIGTNLFETHRERQVKGVLATPVEAPSESELDAKPVILAAPAKNRFLYDLLTRLKLIGLVESTLSESSLGWSVGTLGVATVVGMVAGFILGSIFHVLLFPLLSQIALAVVLGAAPWLYVSFKRRKRLQQFEEQFAEALDFLARSMRSGHAFSVGLEMLGDESPEPLGGEFRSLFNEQNLGAPLETALLNLSRRVPLVDVRLFVSAVLLQRQTGGNLAELLNRLAYVIRERFRLKALVRAVSAHGRITASILTVLPIVTMVALHFVAPGYLESMARDSDGRYLIVAAILAQVLGYFVMKRIVDIKV